MVRRVFVYGDSDLLFDLTMLARFHYSTGSTALDETSCQLPCQHPSCWASQRRQEKGVPHTLPPIVFNRSTPNNETDLPVQSILNLLSEFGPSNTDCSPKSLGEGFSHHCSTSPLLLKHAAASSRTGCQQRFIRSRERNVTCKPASGQVCNAHLHLVEIEDSVETGNFSSEWNQLCMGNKLYVWLPNAKKMPGNYNSRSLEGRSPQCPPLKDVTECMISEEVGHKRQSSILFAGWPTLKKKHTHGRRQTKLSNREKTGVSLDSLITGIGNVQSPYTSHEQVNPHLLGKPYSNQSIDASEMLNTVSAVSLSEHKESICGKVPLEKPMVSLEERYFLHDSLLSNRVIRQRSRNNVLGGYKIRELTMSSHQTSDCHSKMTSISLEHPEISVHAQRPKPFAYGKQEFDFYLGPVPDSLSRYESRFDEDHSDQAPRVGSSTSAALQMQQNRSHPHADEIIRDAGSPPIDTQVTFHEAGTVRSSPIQELQLVLHLPDSHMVPELVSDTRSDLQGTTATRHTEPEHGADRETSLLGGVEITAESPAPPPPSPEPRV